MDFSDFLLDFIIPFVFQKSDINDHINLVSSVCDRIPCLENFGRRCVVSVRESDHCTDRQFSIDILCCLFHIASRDTGRSASIFYSIV